MGASDGRNHVETTDVRYRIGTTTTQLDTADGGPSGVEFTKEDCRHLPRTTITRRIYASPEGDLGLSTLRRLQKTGHLNTMELGRAQSTSNRSPVTNMTKSRPWMNKLAKSIVPAVPPDTQHPQIYPQSPAVPR